MNKKELTSKYNALVARIEDAKMYDGRGTYDLYECKNEMCQNRQVTTYKDKGVTPFTMRCEFCGNTMTHTKTANHIDPFTPVIRWVRPTLKQFLKMDPCTQNHILNGGLVLETDLEPAKQKSDY